MEKVRPWCDQPSDRGRLKKTEHTVTVSERVNRPTAFCTISARLRSERCFDKHPKKGVNTKCQEGSMGC